MIVLSVGGADVVAVELHTTSTLLACDGGALDSAHNAICARLMVSPTPCGWLMVMETGMPTRTLSL